MSFAPGAMAAPTRENKQETIKMILRAWNVSEAKAYNRVKT